LAEHGAALFAMMAKQNAVGTAVILSKAKNLSIAGRSRYGMAGLNCS
jgi:hypothetical protein